MTLQSRSKSIKQEDDEEGNEVATPAVTHDGTAGTGAIVAADSTSQQQHFQPPSNAASRLARQARTLIPSRRSQSGAASHAEIEVKQEPTPEASAREQDQKRQSSSGKPRASPMQKHESAPNSGSSSSAQSSSPYYQVRFISVDRLPVSISIFFV